MLLLLNIIKLIGAVGVLGIATKGFVNTTSELSKHLRISGYTISFLLVGAATSLPEIFVGLYSPGKGALEISYTNVLGSNLVLLGIVTTIAIAIAQSIRTERVIDNKDVNYMIVMLVAFMLTLVDKRMTKIEGALLILIYFLYAIAMIRKNSLISDLIVNITKFDTQKNLLKFAGFLGIIFLCSEVIVDSALYVAYTLNINAAIAGLTITALGTSMPELAYAIGKVIQNKPDDVLGDVIGSVIANSTLVVGITAIFFDLNLYMIANITQMNLLMFSLAVIYGLFCYTKRRLQSLEGVALGVINLAIMYFISVSLNV